MAILHSRNVSPSLLPSWFSFISLAGVARKYCPWEEEAGAVSLGCRMLRDSLTALFPSPPRGLETLPPRAGPLGRGRMTDHGHRERAQTVLLPLASTCGGTPSPPGSSSREQQSGPWHPFTWGTSPSWGPGVTPGSDHTQW